MSYTIALVGNQNSGKTTLFNVLTGSHQHVGNFPGVTVEQKRGYIKKHSSYEIIDLPGIYSLSPYTMEESVAIDFLLEEKPDIILNIVDATCIERNLYLTMQLLELQIPMIIALNMMDVIISSGNDIDVKGLERHLGVAIIPISAYKEEGIDKLIENIVILSQHPFVKTMSFYSSTKYQFIYSIGHLMKENIQKIHVPAMYCITKVIEDDKKIIQKLQLTYQQLQMINQIIKEAEVQENMDRDVILVEMRYHEIERICHLTVFQKQETIEQIRSIKIDKVLTHQYFGIPLFMAVMLLIFYLTFHVLGAPLQILLQQLIDFITLTVIKLIRSWHVDSWLISLLQDGLFAGIGSVLSFLPVIAILFFFLSILEDSGYMARVAFVMDVMLRKIGLSGKSFVPMLIGFGCSVPAIMATRTLSSQRDRKMTIIIAPFLSCSAKLPIYGMIIAAFFFEKAAMAMMIIYLIGLLAAIVSSLLLKTFVFSGEAIPFVMELPAYRIPALKNVMMHMWEKVKDFINKAFTIILLASLVIWFLQNFNFQLEMTESSQSILAVLGTKISWFFKPLGFHDWRLSTALMTGITAKETVISTLSVLTKSSSASVLYDALHEILNPASALSFLTFTALYMPCVAAFAASKKELQSLKAAVFVAVFQTAIAYLFAFVVYRLCLLLI